jgi:hypothetical protein
MTTYLNLIVELFLLDNYLLLALFLHQIKQL